jgi:hypothetical protein
LLVISHGIPMESLIFAAENPDALVKWPFCCRRAQAGTRPMPATDGSCIM